MKPNSSLRITITKDENGNITVVKVEELNGNSQEKHSL